MNWLYFTLIAATGFGIISVMAKDIMADTSAVIYTALYSVLGLIFYTPVFLYYAFTLEHSAPFLAVAGLGVSMVGNVLAFIIYNYSVKEGKLSQVVPITRLTPVFAAAIAAVVLGEAVSIALASGVIFATTGAIIVLKEEKVSYLRSIEDGLHTKAIKAAIISAFLYGVTSVADRYATQIIAPEIYNYFIYVGMSSGLLAAAYYRYSHPSEEILDTFNEYSIYYVFTGIIAAGSSLAIFKAFSAASAAKVTTVLQFQVLIPVIAGVLLFDEKDLTRKLIGSIILIAGIGLSAI